MVSPGSELKESKYSRHQLAMLLLAAPLASGPCDVLPEPENVTEETKGGVAS